jgi:hypothetical protein
MEKPSSLSLSLSLSLSSTSSILCRVKEGYLIWIDFAPHIAKSSRFTIGQRIENKFLDLLELSYTTYFTKKDQTKIEKIAECIFLLDTLKFIISVAWEGKIVPNHKYEELSKKLDETGRMFGGWKNKLEKPEKKNRLA